MQKLPVALLLAIATTLTALTALGARGGVTVAPDHLWEAQQKLKDAEAKIDTLTSQVAQLQSQVSTLQSENADLKKKVEEKDEQLRSAATQPIKLTPEAINPPDLLKDYPQDKMPVYRDPTNPLRIHELNDYLTKKFAGKPVIITGKFQSTLGSGGQNFSITVLTPDPASAPHWTVRARFPTSATDDILKLKRDDTITFSGTITLITYATNPKYNELTLTLKDAALTK